MAKNSYMNDYTGTLHRHPKMEKSLKVPFDHVIVDEDQWRYAREFLVTRETPTNTTKVQIVELVSQLEDAVAESNLTESSKLVTKLKYSAQQL